MKQSVKSLFILSAAVLAVSACSSDAAHEDGSESGGAGASQSGSSGASDSGHAGGSVLGKAGTPAMGGMSATAGGMSTGGAAPSGGIANAGGTETAGAGAKPGGNTSQRAIAYWNAGGLTMMRYHMGAPPNADTYDNSKLAVAQFDNLYTENTSENTSLKSKLDYLAGELKFLQDAKVPVLMV